jgi:hypothetical protein
MAFGALLLILAGAPAPPVSAANPPQVRLICRYEAPATIFGARRKMCLTAEEWEKRVQQGEAASHIMLREYLGNTNCMGQGLCTNMTQGRPSRPKR